MDCRTALDRIADRADGALPPSSSTELDAHLSACAACAAENARTLAVGQMLRSLAALRAEEKAPQLDVLWTRVRAGIAERERKPALSLAWRWAWLPAALALAVFALLFYPTGADRPPLNPRHFDVAVEDVESDVATVALVDKGEELPRVIWIIEDAKS